METVLYRSERRKQKMPIILDDMQSVQATVSAKAVPTYFDKSLTGSGKATGLLNKHFKPARKEDPNFSFPIPIGDRKRVRQDGVKEYRAIPMAVFKPFSQFALLDGIAKIPDNAADVSANMADPVWLLVTASGAVLEQEGTTSDGRKLHMEYMAAIFRANKNPDGSIKDYNVSIKYAPYLDADEIMATDMDPVLLTDYLDSLTVYDTIINAAQRWTTDLPGIFRVLLSDRTPNETIVRLCRRLNDYDVDLTTYWKIYDEINSKRNHILEECCDNNLNLLLNSTLQKAEAIKPQIKTLRSKLPYKPTGICPSIEQMAAITCTEPYIIIQSGAGVGKSFTIQHRLRHMEECGTDMEKVVVLSFTNAAANHIHEIAPTVNSKTIASMICDIYNENFTHQLSQIDTVVNMIDASKNRLAHAGVQTELVHALKCLKKDVNTGMMLLSELAKTHYDELIDILNGIGQTTLELQQAICYHADGKLKEPVIGCDHIIMDEVQDSSIFEFIYILQYAIRHKSTLYFIGDGSQTLYEFRASNPKAMNCLEMSGVFHCLKLQTNYRSNQNILDFANLSLKEIEANRFAGIQLMANEFKVGKFTDNVKVTYFHSSNIREKSDGLSAELGKAAPWINDKLAKGEQVCFLAYTRKDVRKFQDFLKTMYPEPKYKSIDITPAKTYNDSFFSRYVSRLGEDLHHRITADVTVEIMRHMVDNLHILCRDDQTDRLKELIGQWAKQNKQGLSVREIQLQNGLITGQEFKDIAFQTLIDFEIEHNAIAQRVISQKNQEKKEADISGYNFILSTIHSAKGLEFDNVILFYDEDRSVKEDEKRMYYVALTRAKHSEYVIASGRLRNSNIETAYNTMRDAKKKNAAVKAAKLVAAKNGKERTAFRMPGLKTTFLASATAFAGPGLPMTKQAV